MKIYKSILTNSGHTRYCRFCNNVARVKVSGGGCAYCLHHYLVEFGRSCPLGGRNARASVESIQIIGPWLNAALRMGFARLHVMKYYPKAFDKGNQC